MGEEKSGGENNNNNKKLGIEIELVKGKYKDEIEKI